jgi:signal transduction histidine kinase
MNPQQEFINETFHVMAQPITALRAAVELGLQKKLSGPAAHKVLSDCLQLIDSLMGDLSILREIANLDEPPPIDSHDVTALLEECVAEMAPVAESSGIELQLSADAIPMECNKELLQRAVFVLLDTTIAQSSRGGRVSVSLRRCDDGLRLELFPGTLPSQRQELCCKLLQFSGGTAVGFGSCGTSVTFRESASRHIPATSLAHEQFLTAH